jgi:hypothetical protein
MRLLVFGGEGFDDTNAVNATLTDIDILHPVSKLLHVGPGGGASAVGCALRWVAVARGGAARDRIPIELLTSPERGKVAAKNKAILDAAEADWVVVWVTKPTDRDMARQALARGLRVTEVAL